METTGKAREEECVGAAIAPEEPIKDPAVTLGETSPESPAPSWHPPLPRGSVCCLLPRHGSPPALQAATL